MPTEMLVPACRLKGNKTKVDQIMDKLPSSLSDMFKSALVARRQAGSCRRLTNISHVHGRLVIFLKQLILRPYKESIITEDLLALICQVLFLKI